MRLFMSSPLVSRAEGDISPNSIASHGALTPPEGGGQHLPAILATKEFRIQPRQTPSI